MNRKEAILKSVLKLVNREGFYHLNMKKIAEEAGVAAGTIYVHFKGKEDLINELYKMIVHDFRDAVMTDFDKELPMEDIFFSMLGKALDFYLNEPDRFSFLEQYMYSPFLFKETKDESLQLLEPIYPIIKQGKKLGLVRNIPEPMLVALFYGPLIMAMKLHLAHKIDLNKKTTRQQLLNACWDAVTIKETV